MAHPLEPRLAAYRFVLTWTEGGRTHSRKLILRHDPPASLIDTERKLAAAPI